MKTILISDTHFGVKQNSLTWLKYQEAFIHKQLIPYIKSIKEDVRLYHLGDVFDSRSSINTFIASRVKAVVRALAGVCRGGVYIIGGNHDYYSPNDNDENNVCALDLLLEDVEGVTLVTDEPLRVGKDLLVPWYAWDGLDVGAEVKYVFAHTDLTRLEIRPDWMRGRKVFSGHIHTPAHQDNLHTLGSTYALTFADCNADRGFYVGEDGNFTFVPNKESIRFFRIRNEAIFDIPGNDKYRRDDYLELYVDQDLILTDRYADVIRGISEQFHNCTVLPVSIDNQEVIENLDSGYDIEEICKAMIPDELAKKFGKILEKSVDR